VLDGLFVTPAVTAIEETLGTDHKAIAVIGHAKLATALAAAGRTVTPVGLTARAAKKLAGVLADTSTIDAQSLDAWRDTLGKWTRVVRDGGTVVLVDRGHAAEASRRALCAGLMELEQRTVGRAVITSGLVSHF
jgi:hypothetical protein